MDKTTENAPLTRDRVLDDIAELLEIDRAELEPEDNLVDEGLDSIRIMSLVERWNAAGANVGFVDLAERPTLADWLRVLGL
ncbi:phosphopantetheine-binding protein [Amycolatopsis antarctica]|uniref:phosphopantetheine-binding protein n=1 Tax=Amycolatopsis antarctica TaxID=1854586 RepID=UPI001F0AB7D9|nr:phosphopantetheine-binding protein [Amycolatopsis antarctica]